MEGKNQEQAAASAGIGARTGQRWETGGLPSQRKGQRHWRTRIDPFANVWEKDVVPLLQADKMRKLHAKTVIKQLRTRYLGTIPAR